MFHNIKIGRFLILLSVFSINAFATPLYIEISGGQDIGIPIAVVPFSSFKADDPIDRAVEVENISHIINNDLHNSGHFRTLEVENAKNNPHSAAQIDFGYWKNYGAANLVIGTIIPRGYGKYDINFELFDIYKENRTPLVSMRFNDKYPEQFRALAHYISDQIFYKLTGVRGFFSTRIAYITVERNNKEATYTLTVADADGHNDMSLIRANYPMMSPRWSPDGKKLAYVSFKNHRSSINIVTVENGAVEVVSKYPGINSAPAWSPDGTKLAMVLSKDGSPKIYTFDLASKELKRITSGGTIDTEPFWYPDGNAILFTSNRGGKPQIYRVNLSSGAIERVTFTGDYNASPSLTPDGRQLVMLHKSGSGDYVIAVQDLNSGKVKEITKSHLDDSPTIAPNGMMVLYGTRETDQSVLGAVTLDGKFRMRLPIQEGNVKEPAWSPFMQ